MGVGYERRELLPGTCTNVNVHNKIRGLRFVEVKIVRVFPSSGHQNVVDTRKVCMDF